MQIQIDALTSFTGWTFSDPTKVSGHLVNEYRDYTAGNTNATSLVFKFTGASGAYAQKVFTTPISVAEAREIVISVFSRNLRGYGIEYKRATDFKYKIDFGAGKEFYLPMPYNFSDITFFLNGITTVERIRITAVSNDEDYLFLSECVAVKDELPLDILTAIQSRLEADITTVIGNGIEVADVATATAGNDYIRVSGLRYHLEKNALVLIKDATKQEYLHLGENDERDYKLLGSLGSPVLTNSYTSAKLYLKVPVVFGTSQEDVIFPSVAIWGFTPEPVLRGAKLQSIYDTFKTDGTLTERRDAQIQLYKFFLQIESRSNELNAIISQWVRNFLGRETLWMNGRKYEIAGTTPAVEQEPVEGINDIFRHTYEGSIEVKEDIGSRVVLVNTATITGTVSVQE